MPKRFIIACISLLVLMAAADAVWLSTATTWLYRPQLGALLNEMPVLWAAVSFYLLYAAGVSLFVLRPALAAQSARLAFGLGAAFGLVAYGTYDLTNQATIVNWPLAVTLIDMAWGSLLTACTAALAVKISQAVSPQ